MFMCLCVMPAILIHSEATEPSVEKEAISSVEELQTEKAEESPQGTEEQEKLNVSAQEDGSGGQN